MQQMTYRVGKNAFLKAQNRFVDESRSHPKLDVVIRAESLGDQRELFQQFHRFRTNGPVASFDALLVNERSFPALASFTTRVTSRTIQDTTNRRPSAEV